MLSKKKKRGKNMIELLKMLKYRARLYIDKVFELMLDPWILLLRLKMLAQQQSIEFEPNFDTEEVANSEHDESYGDGRPADPRPPAVGLRPALS